MKMGARTGDFNMDDLVWQMDGLIGDEARSRMNGEVGGLIGR